MVLRCELLWVNHNVYKMKVFSRDKPCEDDVNIQRSGDSPLSEDRSGESCDRTL
jgi:hypothetical protein